MPTLAKDVEQPTVVPDPGQLAVYQRILFGSLGVVLLALLLTARWLEPAQQGFGTHQGLGLPPCTVVTLMKIRCPSCGMTTSWAYLTRGRVISSLSSNAGGTLLGLVAMAVVPWSIISSVRGRSLFGVPGSNTVLICVGVVLLVTLIDWAFRLF